MSVIQITDLNDPQLDIYARLSEGQLLHYYEPDLGIFIAESPKVIQTAFEQGYEPISFLVEDRHIKTQAKDIILQYQDIPVYTASFDVLKQLTGFGLTRGMLCAMRRKPLPALETICDHAKRIVILENVMNLLGVNSYIQQIIEGAIIVLACVIFSFFAASPPQVDTTAPAVTMVWKYVGELIFNMLVLVGAVKMSDRIIREMMGL